MASSVVVTGASTGIGHATALRLAASGWRVFGGVRSDADATRLAAQGGQQVTPIRLDVTYHRSIQDAVAVVTEAVGSEGLGGLVNSAGIARGGPVEYLPLEDWREQFEVSVLGQVAVTKDFLPLLRRGQGRLIFMGSMSGRMANPLLAPYCAAKHALEAIAEALRHELRPAGIRVVLIEPGAVKTPMWDKARTAVDAMERSLPQDALDQYRPFLAAQHKIIQHQTASGIPPATVASAVEAALTSARPPARQLVGKDAQALGLLTRLLPDRLRDSLQAKVAGY